MFIAIDFCLSSVCLSFSAMGARGRGGVRVAESGRGASTRIEFYPLIYKVRGGRRRRDGRLVGGWLKAEGSRRLGRRGVGGRVRWWAIMSPKKIIYILQGNVHPMELHTHKKKHK